MGLYNLFGINEVRHTRDSGKKQRFALLSVVWILIGLLFIFYMILLSLAYISMGLADVLPMYFYTVASMVILFFSFFKAGDLVFSGFLARIHGGDCCQPIYGHVCDEPYVQPVGDDSGIYHLWYQTSSRDFILYLRNNRNPVSADAALVHSPSHRRGHPGDRFPNET